MNDSQFDDFVNDRLGEFAAPVPAGLWEKVAEGQFDQFIGGKLKDHIAPVPEGLWDKITDSQFDSFVAANVDVTEAPVPAGLWNRIADGQFDSFVAGKVADHEAPVPAGLWEKIRPEEDDDRGAFWWFRYPAAAVLIIALLTAGAWGGYMFFINKDHAETTQANPSKNTVTQPAIQNTAGDKSGTTNVVPPVSSTEKENTVDNHANPVEPGATPLTDHPVANSVGGIKSNNGNKNNANDDKMSGHLSNSNNAAENIAVTKKGNGLLIPPSSNNSGAINNNYDIVNNKTTVVTNNESGSSAGRPVDDLFIEPYQPGFSEASTVSPARYHSMDLSQKQLSAATNKFKSVIICPADKGRNTDWYLEPYLSSDLAFKSVSNVSATPLYMLKKDSSEHSHIGYSAGVRLVKPLTDNILLKAGLQYTQVNEQYIYRTENEVKTTTVVTVHTIIRAPGDTVVVQDTSVLQTAGFKTNTVRNRFRSFDIPVMVGYQFGGEDLKFGVNAGVVVNLTSWYQGMALDPSLANMPLTKSGNGIYKTNIGLGLIGSVSIVKRLGDDLHIFAEPYFRYNLSNMSTPQSGFNQRLSIGGLAVGLRFKLNKY